MKIKIIETIKKEGFVEISLPAYRKADISPDSGSAIFYYKFEEIDGKVRAISVYVNEPENEVTLSIESNFSFRGQDANFVQGNGGNFSSKEEFSQALNLAKELVKLAEPA